MIPNIMNVQFIILFLVIALCHLILFTNFTDNEYLRKTPKNKSILYWNIDDDEDCMGLGLGYKIFEKCPVNSCFTTNNKSLMSVEDFDAVVLFMPTYSKKRDGLPAKRNPKQKYIFYSLESAFHTDIDDSLKLDFFNWSMTYRKDSDIYFPLGVVYKNKTNYTFENNLSNRRKKVAWFENNCDREISRKRANYVEQLNDYIPVDIHGRCDPFYFSHSVDCYTMLESDYKFYLSFENAMCGDYVTERLFGALNYNIVPIVMGGANYSAIAPPKSYINVDDFEMPAKLAEYLWNLDKNDEEYMKYFQWKKDYIVKNYDADLALCQLCKSLHEPLTYTWYKNIEDWFYLNCHIN